MPEYAQLIVLVLALITIAFLIRFGKRNIDKLNDEDNEMLGWPDNGWKRDE